MERACEQCGGDIIATPGYTEWCPSCDWNVRPKRGDEWRRAIAKPSRVRARAIERTREALMKELPSRPSAGLGGLVLKVLAALVLLFHVLLVVAAVWIMLGSAAKAFSLLFAVPLFVAGVFPFGLVIRRSRGRVECRRSDCPALWAHVERTAAAVGVGRVRRINFDGSFNAEVRRALAGSELTIGLQLWSALPASQRTAVLAHELAHVRNGDPIRGLFVGISMAALEEWYRVLRSVRGGVAAVLAAALAWPVGAYASLMRKLAMLTSQRAEYFADLSAAEAVSTEVLVAALATTHTGDVTATAAMQRVSDGADLWDAIRKRFAQLPDGETRRRRRVAELDFDTDPDGTHPPMGYRIAVLRAHPRTGDASLIAAPEFEDSGFRAIRGDVARHIIRGQSGRPKR